MKREPWEAPLILLGGGCALLGMACTAAGAYDAATFLYMLALVFLTPVMMAHVLSDNDYKKE